MEYTRRIERIRRFYTEMSPITADYLDPPYDRAMREAVRGEGLRRFRWQMVLTTTSMVAVVNGAVSGAVLVMLVALRGGLSLGAGAALGARAFLVSCDLQFWYVLTRWTTAIQEAPAPGL